VMFEVSHVPCFNTICDQCNVVVYIHILHYNVIHQSKDCHYIILMLCNNMIYYNTVLSFNNWEYLLIFCNML
jgi:hypothetical protein